MDENIVVHQKTPNLTKLSEKYATETKTNVERELLKSWLTKEILLENRVMNALASTLCNLQRQVVGIQKLITDAISDLAIDLVAAEGGMITEQMGDAILLKKCSVVRPKVTFWNQSLDSMCFQYLPLVTLMGNTMFLGLKTRCVFNDSHTIPCSSRKDHTFI